MDASTLVLPALIALSLLAILTSAIGIVFQIRRERLPDATRYENVRELRQQEERILAERRDELSLVEQKIQERDRLIAEVTAYEERILSLRAEMDDLSSARMDIDAARREAADVAAELAEKQQHLAALEEKLSERQQAWDSIDQEREAKERAVEQAERRLEGLAADIDRLAAERLELDGQLGPLRAEREMAFKALEEARLMDARIAALAVEQERLLSDIADASALKDEADNVRASLTQMRAQAASLEEDVTRLSALRAKLSAETGTEAGPANDQALLADLRQLPGSLAEPAILRARKREEADALREVSLYLRDLGLKYPDRAVKAFHTALKINDYSQLTVLAGVSGTGKSLLPRRYAEAMGIHFLQIAVEPRWDSPQDLLGFYNYVEKRYRATDLARVLVQLDPFDTSGLSQGDRGDHMALVLLDEMNLARVEYYFSEFLSRLEARPRQAEADDSTKRSDARIPLDIRGLKQQLSLFPSHNILFAGTMNDDESTQSLSDKVLDRSNVMQFAAPRNFEKPPADARAQRPEEGQSFTQWRSWLQAPDSMSDQRRRHLDGHIGKLAEIMERCGRPFGHRLRDAMLAYIANYPKDRNGQGDEAPLADQIEYRILPKLRGVDLESRGQEFDDLERLLRDLSEPQFADRLADLRQQQESGTGLFVWRGLTRGE
ncbi:AAA family ATPase [Devosia sp. RR2S18]|uniref:AAA family ATPase n=1 Tax=Devosia rhizosphaerae TaxID=3049774 RepID=UPI00253FC40E|nr:AAA family ATPase [Devosia sp. RR2S18]WIJ25795.1 AAA family ATPase [Devosia sp. RR2S18]